MGPQDFSYHDITETKRTAGSPEVAVCLPVEQSDLCALPGLLAELARPCAVALDVVLCDLTLDGDLSERFRGELERLAEHACGVRVVRGVPGARGGAYLAALRASDAPLCAWQLARAHAPAGRFALQAAALAAAPDAEIALCDLVVRGGARAGAAAGSGDAWIGAADELGAAGEAGATAERIVSLASACVDAVPPSCWESAVMVRRDVLARIAPECFAPAEMELLFALRAEGKCVHVPEPLAAVDADAFDARGERTERDAQLLELAQAPHDGPPEVTVLLATHDRRDVFVECLEGFSRQLVPPGLLEIVAIDDGSRDGTAELAQRLDLPVAFTFLRQDPADGASRARILGLPHARGRLVLFVNDDTIPFADTVRRHVEAHAELAPRRVAVLGTFEQPAEHLTNAFMRLQEDSNFVFGYQGLTAGQELPPAYFYTCHVSVELDAVRAVGGFDPEFSHYGCEDTDLGVRLGKAGVPIVYRPECRALHRHFLSFDTIRRRQRVVAKAHVRLFEKFPELLDEHAWWRDLTAAEIQRRNAGVLPFLDRIEAACRSLASVDTARLADGGCGDTAKRIAERLGELFPKVNKVWWDLGFEEGFKIHGIDGFPALRTNGGRELSTHA